MVSLRTRLREGLPPAVLLFGVVLAACAAMVVQISWRQGREAEALLRMSAPVRAKVFDGAMATLVELCRRPEASPALEGRCQDQARFVAMFPECDRACRDLVAANAAAPTR